MPIHGTLQEFLRGKELRPLKEAHSGDLHRLGAVIQAFSGVGGPNENGDFSQMIYDKISTDVSKGAMQCVTVSVRQRFYLTDATPAPG